MYLYPDGWRVIIAPGQMSRYKPGDVVFLPDDKFYVYELIDDSGVCFYIGITNDPQRRLSNHYVGRFNLRLRAKIRSLVSPRLVILSPALSGMEARKLERKLIRERPGLVNQEHRADYRSQHGRHPVFDKYLRTASKV